MKNKRCKRGCCEVIFCPLNLVWAYTIHKFSGRESFIRGSRLLVDPGRVQLERLQPGFIYTALSKAKSIGSPEKGILNHESSIYWTGPNMCDDRIAELSNQNTPTHKLLQYRKMWVEFLSEKNRETKQLYNNDATTLLKARCKQIPYYLYMGESELYRRIRLALHHPNF